jgi:hypothetical protein
MGLAGGVAAQIVATLAMSENGSPATILVLQEPIPTEVASPDMTLEQASMEQYKAAGLAQSCGVEALEISMPSHGGPFTEIRIDRTHPEALNCLLAKSASQGVEMNFDRTNS